MRRLIVALLCVALSLTQLPLSAHAALPVTHIIKANPGGIIVEFIEKYLVWADRGDKVKVEGWCNSSCTLLLGALDRRKICATPGAVFGFHSASTGPFYSLAGTKLMWNYYGSDVRAALARRGWPQPSYHPNIIEVPALELVHRCA